MHLMAVYNCPLSGLYGKQKPIQFFKFKECMIISHSIHCFDYPIYYIYIESMEYTTVKMLGAYCGFIVSCELICVLLLLHFNAIFRHS